MYLNTALQDLPPLNVTTLGTCRFCVLRNPLYGRVIYEHFQLKNIVLRGTIIPIT
jgi:hypothetical protein